MAKVKTTVIRNSEPADISWEQVKPGEAAAEYSIQYGKVVRYAGWPVWLKLADGTAVSLTEPRRAITDKSIFNSPTLRFRLVETEIIIKEQGNNG